MEFTTKAGIIMCPDILHLICDQKIKAQSLNGNLLGDFDLTS